MLQKFQVEEWLFDIFYPLILLFPQGFPPVDNCHLTGKLVTKDFLPPKYHQQFI